jgi:transcriptional regulator with GAF, ATPase, and Fis domain
MMMCGSRAATRAYRDRTQERATVEGCQMVDPTWRQVGGALHDLSRLLLTFQEPDDLLQQIAEAACEIVPATTNCSVSLVRDGVVRSVAIANEKARHLDDLQYEHGDGPCLEATRTTREVLSQDLHAEGRWGDFRSAMIEHGIRSTMALPLDVDHGAEGALNIYSEDLGAFDEPAIVLARLVAGQAATVMSGVLRHRDQAVLTEQLRAALSSRAVIDQAIGVVMAHQGCPPEQALATLKKASQHQNVKLRVIAQEIVESAGTARTGADLTGRRRNLTHRASPR